MTKEETYIQIVLQAKEICQGEANLIANMANISALIYRTFKFWWTGFYIVDKQQLILGPFQGPIACTRINFGRGVCGSAWQRQQTIIVPNVDEFPGHIACSGESKSEIVVPVYKNGSIIAVLDIDSERYNTFDDIDKTYLEKIVMLLDK